MQHPTAIGMLAGAAQLILLQQLAGLETLLDSLWQRNCFTQALQSVAVQRCQTMNLETKSRLALALANCQLQACTGSLSLSDSVVQFASAVRQG